MITRPTKRSVPVPVSISCAVGNAKLLWSSLSFGGFLQEALNRAPLLLNSAELCLKQPVFRVKDPPNSRGWMLEDDLKKHLDRLNPVRHKTINLTVDGEYVLQTDCAGIV